MTNAELAILMLIAEAPRHGYEIEQLIEARGLREWTDIGFSSIYYILKKLEKQGLVESRLGEQSGRGPAPRIYSLTPAGWDEWQRASLDALRGEAFLLGLANLPGLPPDAALDAIRTYRQSIRQRLDHMHAAITRQQPLPSAAETLFSYSITLAEAELNWLDQFITRLEETHDHS